ncbi:phosphoribosyltransferase family protein [Chryseobacterium gotjawalense]|uniref:Phosphoribosyltransferase family protein n=1 Tax=Chryseobacterium gotjawalense TaxID=3042315 RepID=A0ABY8RG47_9FLAO|nr:phosphoribosyltransferase family protein [Chryseobacterium sp. wdc7]WHF52499.1 phosphoribosyltransferase family protein [Chryseobacterium sp. wdc7]
MIFNNRYDAAMRLVPLLKKYADTKGVVLAIPRGAVPMGFYIAKELHLPLDLLLTKKIGHPQNPELAVGSVSMEGRVVDPRFNMDEDFIERETVRIRATLKDRYKKFMGNRSSIDLKDKTVIIVDDGIATGNTMLLSVDLVKHHAPEKVVVATPVAAPEALRKLRMKADEVICLYAPEDFRAVGEFYDDFSQVTDDEVIDFLNRLSTEHKTV